MSSRRRNPTDHPAHRNPHRRRHHQAATPHTNRRRHTRSSSEDRADEEDIQQFTAHLAQLGLYVRDVESDGNCLFRAFSDQLHGVETHHKELRACCVTYLRRHEDDFAPFVEDDRSFSSYVAEMTRDGVWGGNLELQALSMALSVNIRIHQLSGTPCFDIRNHHQPNARVVHLSYHRDQHYGSVRPKNEKHSYGPANHKPLPPSSNNNNRTLTNTPDTVQDGDATSTSFTNSDSDASSTSLLVAPSIFEDVSDSVCNIRHKVADALRSIRAHCSCQSPDPHQMKKPHLPQNIPTSKADRCACDCHGDPPRAKSHHQQSCVSLEAEAVAILELLEKADKHKQNIISISRTPCEHANRRTERERKYMIDNVSEASDRALALDQLARLLCRQSSRDPSAGTPRCSKTEGKASKRPSKKSVQEAKRIERKERRRIEQEQQARAAKYDSTKKAEVSRSTRIDI